MTELRPISLCNVSYKIASKVLANRFKKILDGVISETQSAFIPGRLMSDNTMIAYEVMHYMKRKVGGRAGRMALKLDMSKAYDRVEWSFLRAMLEKLGFDRRLVNLLLECVTSARYRINHSGKEFGLIVPERGIRQGDPLSSYIFLICMEGLTTLIQENVRRKNIKGIKVARGAPILSHLFFADDNYIYCQANSEAANKVISMLQVYEKASGSEGCCNILQFQEAGANTTYLGLPSIIGRNKKAVLGYLKERMQTRIEGYDKKLLSKGGKEILLKTVVQALPSYAMSGSFLTASLGCNPSFVWRSVLETQEMLKKDTDRRVGSGNSVDVLQDPWLPCVDDPYIHTIQEALVGKKVSSLMETDQSRWNMELISDIFIERDANLILSIPLQRSMEDSWYWRREKMGQYSVRSAYAALSEKRDVNHSSDNSGFWRRIWNLKIPLKVKHFLWRAITGCLPTKEQLISRRVEVIEQCPLCNLEPESVAHVLTSCPFAKLCWSNFGCKIATHTTQSFQEWMSIALQQYSGEALLNLCMICWSLLKNRNAIVWNQKGAEFVEVVASTIQVLDHWKNAQDRSYDSSFGFMNPTDGDMHWKQPQEGMIKVNTDAALFEDSNCYSYAMVARDHERKLIEALSS
nr:PREDICTED: uncharacterized protein LOC108198150 [Daucus carota subsp. sativus]